MEVFKNLGLDQEFLYRKLSEYLTPKRKALIKEKLDSRTRFLTLAIDDIQKEHNSGALIRTAESFGVQQVSIVDPEFRKKSARNISIGSHKWVDFEVFDSWLGEGGCLNNLKKQGYDVVATSSSGQGVSLDEFEPKRPTALLFGNEIDGLPEEVIRSADREIYISTHGFSESLNVSVAAGIILFELSKRIRNNTLAQEWGLSASEKNEKRVQWATKSIPNGEQILERIIEDHST